MPTSVLFLNKGQRSSFTKRRNTDDNFHKAKAPSSDGGSTLTEEDIKEGIKLGEGDEEDIITFTSEEDKMRKMEKLSELRGSDGKNKELTDFERQELENEEKQLRKNVLRASLHYGDISKEKAKAMHALGKNLFRQAKYSYIYTISWDILALHEKLDGPDSMEFHQAITNVASTAWKLGEREPARILSRRQLGILQEQGKDEAGKEIMMIRARLLSYQDPLGKEVPGTSHKEFKKQIAQYELTSEISNTPDVLKKKHEKLKREGEL